MEKIIYDFLESIDDLQHIIHQETTLLKEGKTTEAIQLFSLKEATIRRQTEIQEELVAQDALSHLTPQQLEEIVDTLNLIKKELSNNQRVLDSAYKAHQTLIHLCVEAVKSCQGSSRLYTHTGAFSDSTQKINSMVVNKII